MHIYNIIIYFNKFVESQCNIQSFAYLLLHRSTYYNNVTLIIKNKTVSEGNGCSTVEDLHTGI